MVNSGNANAATGERGMNDAAAMCAAAARGRRRRAKSGRGRIDRCDRRSAADREDHRAASRGSAASCAPDGAEDFAEAIRTTDAFPKQVTLDVALAGGHRPAQRPGQGCGHDLAELRHAARVRTDRRRNRRRRGRPAAVGLHQALIRSHQRRRTALDLRHDRAAGIGCLGRADRAQDRRRARVSARRSTRRCGRSRCWSPRTARVRAASGAWSSRAGTSTWSSVSRTRSGTRRW